MKFQSSNIYTITFSEIADKIDDLQDIADLFAIPDCIDEYPHNYWTQSMHLVQVEDFAAQLDFNQEKTFWEILRASTGGDVDWSEYHVMLNA